MPKPAGGPQTWEVLRHPRMSPEFLGAFPEAFPAFPELLETQRGQKLGRDPLREEVSPAFPGVGGIGRRFWGIARRFRGIARRFQPRSLAMTGRFRAEGFKRILKDSGGLPTGRPPRTCVSKRNSPWPPLAHKQDPTGRGGRLQGLPPRLSRSPRTLLFPSSTTGPPEHPIRWTPPS